jgi:NAD-dependent deacetylase
MLVFVGAGISTASGIPDFRGPGGLWTRRRPVYYQDFMASDAARVEYWDQKLEAWDSYKLAQPNAVHHAIVALERAGRVLAVVTQNIDGLHHVAGTSPDLLVELHGTDRFVECQSCHEMTEPVPHLDAFKATRKPPRCRCGGWLKPATISFGQALRPRDMDRAVEAAEGADLVLALGSTLSVYPAASIPLMAASRGVPYVIVNRGETEHDHYPSVTLRLDGDLMDIVAPAVNAALAS